jgi:hypothetical protein
LVLILGESYIRISIIQESLRNETEPLTSGENTPNVAAMALSMQADSGFGGMLQRASA